MPYLQGSELDFYSAVSLDDARTLLLVLKPALAIIDRELQDGDGLELIDDAARSNTRTMMVSERFAPQDRIKALSLGADDYLSKPAEAEEVFLRARRILAALPDSGVDGDMIRDYGGVRVELTTRALLRPDGGHADELTETELAVLKRLAENMDRIVSRETLHAIVTGEAPTDQPTRAVDTCLSRLRIKLRAADARVEIRSVRQAGYLFRQERSAKRSA